MSHGNGSLSDFDKNKTYLQDWPYTTHSIEESLDIDLIEGRAWQLLYQAISKRNLIGFVGSGVSMAYGRLGWTDWLRRQLGTIRTFAQTHERIYDASLQLLLDLSSKADHISNSVFNFDDQEKVIFNNFLNERLREISYRADEFRDLYKTFNSLNKNKGAVLVN